MQPVIEKQPALQELPTKIWNPAFISIVFASLIMNLGQSMSNSLLSKYADSIGATASVIGVLSGMFAISALLFKLISAPAMDTYNRKYLLIGSMFILVLVFVGFGLSRTIPQLMAFRLLQGIGLAFGNVCGLALAAETLPKDRYGAGIGYYSMGQVLANAIAPTIGLALSSELGYQTTYMISAGIMLLAAVLAMQIKLKFKRTRKMTISLNRIIAKEALLPATIMIFLALANHQIGAFLIVFAGKQGIGKEIGVYFTVSAVTSLLTRPLVGRLTDKHGFIKVFIPSIFAAIIAFFLISAAHSLYIFLLAAFISAFGYGASIPLLQTLAMKSVPNERRGAGSSTNFIGADIGTIAGPMIGGVVAQAFGYTVMWRVMVIPLFIAILLVIFLRKKIAIIESEFKARA